MRISLDSKAKVKIGNLSRQGKARYPEPLKADDHDSEWRAVLVPLGILDMRGERLSIYFGQSAETSDFVADCLELWWQENQAIYPGLELEFRLKNQTVKSSLIIRTHKKKT